VGLGKKRKETNPGFGKYCSIAIYQKSQKFIKSSMGGTIPGRQKGKAKQRPKDAQPTGTKKTERANPSGGGYTQSPRGVRLKDDFSLEANTKCFCTLVPV
jgi:hypothetical protein